MEKSENAFREAKDKFEHVETLFNLAYGYSSLTRFNVGFSDACFAELVRTNVSVGRDVNEQLGFVKKAALIGCGLVLLQSSEPEDAKRVFWGVIYCNPHSPNVEARLGLSWCVFMAHQYDLAVKFFDRTLELIDCAKEIEEELFRRETEEISAAYEDVECTERLYVKQAKAFAMNTLKEHRIRCQLGKVLCYVQSRHFDKAYELFFSIIERDTTNSLCRLYISDLMFSCYGNLGESLAQATEALKHAKHDRIRAEAHYFIGRCHHVQEKK